MILQSPEHPQKVRLDQINDELCLLSFIVRWVILVAEQHKLQAKLFFWQKKIDLFEKVKLVVPISNSRPRSSPCQIRSTLFKSNYVAAKCDTNSPERWLEYETVEPLLDISTEKSINIDQEYQLILS